MKDARGYEYEELTAIQENHLALWKTRLKHDLYAEVAAYVRDSNRAALSPEDRHRVFRGQDIVQIIMDWPNLIAVYPPSASQSASVI